MTMPGHVAIYRYQPEGPGARQLQHVCFLSYGRQDLHITTCGSLGFVPCFSSFGFGPQSALQWMENPGCYPGFKNEIPLKHKEKHGTNQVSA
jgi:hypothetical protein